MSPILLGPALGLLLSALAWALTGPAAFQERAAQAGLQMVVRSGSADKQYLMEGITGGVALLDFDGDGFLDIYLANGSSLEAFRRKQPGFGGRLFRNDGSGGFEDVTARAGLKAGPGWGMGGCAADFDGDGWTDLYLTNWGPNQLYRNNGDGTFQDVSAASGTDYSGCSTGCAWTDADGDGRLDLYVANYVRFDPDKLPLPGSGRYCFYLGIPVACGPLGLEPEADIFYFNNGNATFSEGTRRAGLDAPPAYGFGVLAADYDNDGDSDLFVANDSTPNFLFQNQGRGVFQEVALAAGVAFNEDGRAQACMGLDAADYDGDGFLDFVVTNFSRDNNTLYRNQGDGTFLDASIEAGMGDSFLFMSWGVGFLDFDRDGRQDLLVVNGHLYPQAVSNQTEPGYAQPDLFYRNLGGGRFLSSSSLLGGPRPHVGRGAAFGDLDNDGAVDVVVSNLDGSPELLMNRWTGSGRWLSVSCRGRPGNRSAIGARVTVTTAAGTQFQEIRAGGSYLSSNDPRLHFGLGGEARLAEVSVRWPSGTVSRLQGVKGNRLLVIEEPAPEPHSRTGRTP